jgi:hypothetical protein
MHYSKQKVKKLAKLERNIGTGKKHWNWKETLELERNFGALADSPSIVTFLSSFLFQNLSNQSRLAVTV